MGTSQRNLTDDSFCTNLRVQNIPIGSTHDDLASSDFPSRAWHRWGGGGSGGRGGFFGLSLSLWTKNTHTWLQGTLYCGGIMIYPSLIPPSWHTMAVATRLWWRTCAVVREGGGGGGVVGLHHNILNNGWVRDVHGIVPHRWELPVLRYLVFRVNYPFPFLGVILMVILYYFIIKNCHKN